MSRRRRKPRVTSEKYWEWRAKEARRIRPEEFVLYLAVATGLALIVLAAVLFS